MMRAAVVLMSSTGSLTMLAPVATAVNGYQRIADVIPGGSIRRKAHGPGAAAGSDNLNQGLTQYFESWDDSQAGFKTRRKSSVATLRGALGGAHGHVAIEVG